MLRLQKYLGKGGSGMKALKLNGKRMRKKILNQAIQEAEPLPLPDPKEMFLYTFAEPPPR